MIDFMQHQDLAGAMLLYDDINRKGFEGDLVLNGFAEFLRNLLVCKDEKVVSLLEVVESFKDRYVSVGKKTSASYLISALNVLNEAEINYKAARNKRLHVELAIIKLTYLQQALEFTPGNEGAVKKKVVETAKPVAYRNIPLVYAATPHEHSVTISENSTSKRGSSNKQLAVENKAKLIIESTDENELVTTEDSTDFYATSSQPSSGKQETILPKLGKLQNIRDKFVNKPNGNEQTVIPLTIENLREAWQQFTEQLKEKKNPAFQSFEMAELDIVNEGRFDVITNNNLEQRFIEQEKRRLCEHLQQHFRNKTLSLSIRIKENPDNFKPEEKHLSKKEQFQKIVEQYPLVKELKDRLRMELDY
jgi:DNA polymerase-3 subunit gamma/tau